MMVLGYYSVSVLLHYGVEAFYILVLWYDNTKMSGSSGRYSIRDSGSYGVVVLRYSDITIFGSYGLGVSVSLGRKVLGCWA